MHLLRHTTRATKDTLVHQAKTHNHRLSQQLFPLSIIIYSNQTCLCLAYLRTSDSTDMEEEATLLACCDDASITYTHHDSTNWTSIITP